MAGEYAYNRKDFGNFVWGASMRKLSFSLFTAQWGAHANAFLNDTAITQFRVGKA